MPSRIETTYLAMRERILLGECPAGTPLTADAIAAQTGVAPKMARQLLIALSGGGYLRKRGNRYVVASFDEKQLVEWHTILGSLVEIGAVNLALSGQKQVEAITARISHGIPREGQTEEDFFITAIELSTAMLGGPRSALAQLSEQLVPQAFYRLLWLSDALATRRGFLLEAAERFVSAAPKADLAGVRAACRHYFDGTAPALAALGRDLQQGLHPAREKVRTFSQIEPRLGGAATTVGGAYRPRMLIEPLSEAAIECDSSANAQPPDYPSGRPG